MNKKIIVSFLIILLFLVNPAHSQVLELKVKDYGWLDSLPFLKPILDDYLKQEEAKLNADQPIKDAGRFMQGTANSTALASRGIGSDYVSPMEKFMLGVSIGAAIDAEKDVALENEVSGIGGAAGLMFGAKIREDLSAFVNLGGLSHSRTFSGIEDTDLDAEISTINFGAHLSYDLIQGDGKESFGWGGVKVQFGYEFNQNDLTFVDVLNEDLELDTGVAVIQGRLKGAPRYEIKTTTHSFPLEVSSNVRFLKYFSVFGGTGLDINFGTAKGTGDIRADVTSPLTCASGICSNLNLPEVQVTGNLDTKKNVNQTFLRAFGGLQINISHGSIYGMVNKVIGTDVTGVSGGIRAIF